MCRKYNQLVIYWNSELIIIVKLLEIQILTLERKILNGFSNSQFVYYLYQVTENSYRKIIDTWLEQKNLTLTRKKIYQYEVKT